MMMMIIIIIIIIMRTPLKIAIVYYYYYYYYYYFLFCTLADLIPIYLLRERVITHDQRILRFHLLTLLSSSFTSALKFVVPLKTIPDFRP